MKADLEMCPPWILSKLKTERDLRRKLAEQTKEQTRILLEEVKDWRAKAYNYQREAQEKEAQRKKKQEELDRIKEMVRAIVILQPLLPSLSHTHTHTTGGESNHAAPTAVGGEG